MSRKGAKAQRSGLEYLHYQDDATMHENEIAKFIVDAAFHIHSRLGPGLLEPVYEVVLAHEVRGRGLEVQRQLDVPVVWDSISFDKGFQLDLLVGRKVIVEVKSIEKVHPVHKKQVLTYLRLMDCRLGLLVNFGDELIKNGISRIVDGLDC